MGVSFRWALAPYLREGISDILGRGLVIRVLTVLARAVGKRGRKDGGYCLMALYVGFVLKKIKVNESASGELESG